MKFKELFKNRKLQSSQGKSDYSEHMPEKKLSKTTREYSKKDILQFWGLSDIMPNPDPVLRKLGKSQEAYSSLLSDSHLYGCIQSRKSGVLQLEWDLCGEDSNEKKLVKECLSGLNIYDLISSILDATLFGYQPLEICWKRNSKSILPEKIQSFPRRSIKFDFKGSVKIVKKDGELLKPNRFKFLVPRYDADYENPYGNPLLSKCYWNVIFKKNGKKFWITFTEKFGMPWVMAKYPKGTKKDRADEILEKLMNMFQDGILVHPENLDVRLESQSNSSSADIFEKLINDCRIENSILMLGHPGAVQHVAGKLGNDYAADKASKRIIDSDKRFVENTINELIAMICELNFNSSDTPKFKFFEEEDTKKEQAERDKILTGCGLKFRKEYFESEYNLKKEHFEVG